MIKNQHLRYLDASLVSRCSPLTLDTPSGLQAVPPYALVFAHAAPLPQHPTPTPRLPVWLKSQCKCYFFWKSLSSVPLRTRSHTRYMPLL